MHRNEALRRLPCSEVLDLERLARRVLSMTRRSVAAHLHRDTLGMSLMSIREHVDKPWYRKNLVLLSLLVHLLSAHLHLLHLLVPHRHLLRLLLHLLLLLILRWLLLLLVQKRVKIRICDIHKRSVFFATSRGPVSISPRRCIVCLR